MVRSLCTHSGNGGLALNVMEQLMKRGSRPDLNHEEIRDGLKQIIGKQCVRDTKDIGGGFPDLVIGFRGQNYFLEVKSDENAKLTPAETAFHMTWEGQIDIVYSLDDAMKVIGLT